MSRSLSGAIPWLMVSEMFLQESRAVAVTIATIVNWLANFVVGLAFPYILVCELHCLVGSSKLATEKPHFEQETHRPFGWIDFGP